MIGKTSVVKVDIFKKSLYLKLEYQNIAGSIKDRVAYYILDKLKKEGKIDKNTIICEATSGNTGIGIASFCAKNNLKSLIFVPENISLEKIKSLKLFKANLVLTPSNYGLAGATSLLKDFLENKVYIVDKSFVSKKDKDLFGKVISHLDLKKLLLFKKYHFDQFNNELNWKCHYETTAKEIYDFIKENNINIDAFGCGVGTGGSLYGISKFLKSKFSDIKIFSVYPKSFPHDIEGIGPNFTPPFYKRLKEEDLLDEEIKLNTYEVKAFLKDFISHTGIPIGISASANILGSLIFLDKHNLKSAFTLVPDSAFKYITKLNI